MFKLIMAANHVCYPLLRAREDIKVILILTLAMPVWMNGFLCPTVSEISPLT